MQDAHLINRKFEQRISNAGRPSRNPFHQPEVQVDFGERARAVVKRYFNPSPENTKKPFVLPGGVRLGKTAFWALIFYFYIKETPALAEKKFCPLFEELEHPLVDENLDHFLRLLEMQIGREACGDRGATCKNVNSLKDTPGLSRMTDIPDRQSSRGFNPDKYRRIYQVVLKCWYEVLSAEDK